MTGAALVLPVADTCIGRCTWVTVEMTALRRDAGRYPALCGALAGCSQPRLLVSAQIASNEEVK